MGTRSSIAVKHGTRVKGIYCHWDGYLDHNGRILLGHYDSTKANNLVAFGNLSGLQAEIGEQHAFSKFDTPGIESRVHNEDWCTFYGRDRGESGQEFQSFASEDEWMDYFEGSGCEYFYLMDSGVWYVSENGRDLVPLHEAVEQHDLATYSGA